jgi:hypothetical protein
VPTLKVVEETPLSLHGDMADSPRPAPNAMSRRAKAAAATAPAAIAGHDTPDTDGTSTIAAVERSSDSMKFSRWK